MCSRYDRITYAIEFSWENPQDLMFLQKAHTWHQKWAWYSANYPGWIVTCINLPKCFMLIDRSYRTPNVKDEFQSYLEDWKLWFREQWSWLSLNALKSMCHRFFFQVRVHVSWGLCIFHQVMKNSVHFAFFKVLLEVNEAYSLAQQLVLDANLVYAL